MAVLCSADISQLVLRIRYLPIKTFRTQIKFYCCFREINIAWDHILNSHAWNKYTQELYVHVFISVTLQAHCYDSLGRFQRVHSRRWDKIQTTFIFFFFFYGASARCLVTASPISFLQNSLFLTTSFQLRVWSKSIPSRQTVFSHLLVRFSAGLLPPEHPPITFVGDGRHYNHPSFLSDQPTVISGTENVRSATLSCNLYVHPLSNSLHPLDLGRHHYLSEGIQKILTGLKIL